MKTQLQYPNGLSITIEYNANEATQLPEVDKFTAEAISYQHRDLLDEIASLKKLIDIYHKDLKELSEKVHAIPAPATIRAHEFNAIFSTDHGQKKEKSGPMFSVRKCTKCGKMFQPNGPRGNTCTQCKAELSSLPDEKTETPE